MAQARPPLLHPIDPFWFILLADDIVVVGLAGSCGMKTCTLYDSNRLYAADEN